MANLFRCGNGGSSGGGAKIYYLGKGTSFNIAELLSDVDYTKLTVDNFIVGICDLNFAYTSAMKVSTTYMYRAYLSMPDPINKSYESTTGILSIENYDQEVLLQRTTSSSQSTGFYTLAKDTANHTCFAYLVLGDIEDVSDT